MVTVYHLREHGICEVCGHAPDHYHMLKVLFDPERGLVFSISNPFPGGQRHIR